MTMLILEDLTSVKDFKMDRICLQIHYKSIGYGNSFPSVILCNDNNNLDISLRLTNHLHCPSSSK